MIVEATGIVPEGRITPGCTGLWTDAQVEAFKPIVAFARAQGTVMAVQLAHAGRKAGCDLPWRGGRQVSMGAGGWQALAPSAVPFRAEDRAPRAMTKEDIARVIDAFAASARRAIAAGFEMVEIHAAHGYLLHSFLSPLSNRRDDDYGGDLAGRSRLLRDVTAAVKAELPADCALAVRLSCRDWAPGGLEVADCAAVAGDLKMLGVDLIDCSSGGLVPDAKIVAGPGYQVPFAAQIRAEAAIATAAVGLITTPEQAGRIIAEGAADLVLLGRVLLRDPYWALKAAALAGADIPLPRQYERGIDRDSLLASLR